MESLKLKEELLKVQIQMQELQAENAKNASSSKGPLPETAVWGQNYRPNKYVNLGTIPRMSRNNSFPAKATDFAQFAETDHAQGKSMATPGQTATGKEHPNPLIPVALGKSKSLKGKAPKESKSTKRKKPLPTQTGFNTQQTFSNPNTFEFTPQPTRKWKINQKRPLDEESLSIINTLFQQTQDIKILRQLEKKLTVASKNPEENLSYETPIYNVESKYKDNERFNLVKHQDLRNHVFPTFFFKKDWWNNIFSKLQGKHNLESCFLGIDEKCFSNDKVDFRNLITISNKTSPDFVWQMMDYGFLNQIVFRDLKDFKNCPEFVKSFANDCLQEQDTGRIMVLSSNPVYQYEQYEDDKPLERHLQYWISNPPQEMPSTIVLVEITGENDELQSQRPFGSTKIVTTLNDPEDVSHVHGMAEIKRFMKTIETNPWYKVESKGRITTVRRFKKNKLSLENQLILEQHLNGYVINDEFEQDNLEDYACSDDSKADKAFGEGPSTCEEIPTQGIVESDKVKVAEM